jgi:hypothetical protein
MTLSSKLDPHMSRNHPNEVPLLFVASVLGCCSQRCGIGERDGIDDN